MEWLTWPLVVLVGIGMAVIGITSVAIRVDWVEWCKYRDNKKAEKRKARIQANCTHYWIDQSNAGLAMSYCCKCYLFVDSHRLQELVRQGRIERVE